MLLLLVNDSVMQLERKCFYSFSQVLDSYLKLERKCLLQYIWFYPRQMFDCFKNSDYYSFLVLQSKYILESWVLNLSIANDKSPTISVLFLSGMGFFPFCNCGLSPWAREHSQQQLWAHTIMPGEIPCPGWKILRKNAGCSILDPVSNFGTKEAGYGY